MRGGTAARRDGTIRVDGEDARPHDIAGEADVVVPDGLEAFAALKEVEPKTVRNRVVRLGRDRERSSQSGALGRRRR